MPNSFSPDSLRRIRRLAFVVRAMCMLGLLAIGTLPFLFWAQPDWVAEVVVQQWAIARIQLDMGSRLGGLAGSLLPTAVSAFALIQMWSLFGCFARGELLARRPARHLRWLGVALSLLAFAQPLGRMLSILALTWGNGKGERQLALGVSSDHYLSLLFGLLLLALAQVLAEAARVAEEHSEFV